MSLNEIGKLWRQSYFATQLPDAVHLPKRTGVHGTLHEMPQVTLAAINGSCAGAGFGWAAACDLRVAVEHAKFATAFLDIGVAGDMGLPWTLTANGAIIRDTINIFGPERAMFASNYPVDSLAGSFQMIYGGFRAAVSNRPPDERRMLFHDNAVRIYRL